MNDTDNVDIVSDDLDEFEKDFYNTREETQDEVEESDEDEVEPEDDSLATDEDDADPEESDEDPEEDEEADEEGDDEPEPDPKPKSKKRNRAQERIEELVAEARIAQREAEALRKQLEEIRQKVPADSVKETDGLRDKLPPEAPNPDATKEDGEPVYALGEFDPAYIRDLTKFTIEQERKADAERAAQEAQAREIEAAQQELANHWQERLEEVKKNPEFEDFDETIKDLEPVVQDIDPNYGDFLATTIMSSEFGPQIMYYLANNIGEAQKIVASGPAAATRAIGRLEARFESRSQQEEKRNKRKVSNAPAPAENRTRGNRGQFNVRPDTDDLDAFEREFYKK